ncbi:hypothetical protein P7C73_g3967, partial [Tremellales sp. Uapishka_1]
MLFQPILTLLLVSLVPSVLSAFSPTTSELESRRAHHHGAHGQSFDSNFAQHAPSAAPSSSRRAVHKRTIIPATLPLGTRNDLARCPETMMACPISALPTETEWECVHPDEDLYSCGGCSTMSTGEDCTSISSAQSVSCEAGACRVHSCEYGYGPSTDGKSCIAQFTQ